MRRKNAWDTSGRWFEVRNVESCRLGGEPSCLTGVRISDIIELGQFEILRETVPAPDRHCCSSNGPMREPGKEKRQKSATPVPSFAPKFYLCLMMKQLYCWRDEGFISMIRILKLLSKSSKKLWLLVRVVLSVVLHLCSSPVHLNLMLVSFQEFVL